MVKRGFKIVTGYKDQDIHLPKRGSTHAAGYDFEAAETVAIEPKQVVAVATGVKAYMGVDEVLKIYARSSLGAKRHLTLANGVGIIDADYYDNPENEGHICILLLNFGEDAVIIQKGERIAQGIFEPFLTADQDGAGAPKRLGGFGSTGL